METKERREMNCGVRAKGSPKDRKTMHENIGHWCDCCTCEAEPHWQELAERLGIDLSDREEEELAEDPIPEEAGSFPSSV